MDKTTELIQNKKVIIVGPAPSLKGLGYGEWIDLFDTVVRTNGSIYLLEDEDYRKDYGSRCDILYANAQFTRVMSPFPIEEWLSYGLKCLISKSGRPQYEGIFSRSLSDPSLLLPELQGALSGPMLIHDILEHSPEELWVTGFDFYHHKLKKFELGNYKEYVDGYLPEKVIQEANIINQQPKSKSRIHDPVSNTEYIYNLYIEGKIYLDVLTEKYLLEAVEAINAV